MCSIGRTSWRGWASIFGGALITLACGSLYSYGNMVPYIVSYVRKHGRESGMTYEIAILCTSLLFAMCGVGMPLGLWVYRYLELRKAILLGCLLGCDFEILRRIGTLTSYWTIGVSFYLFLLTFGGLYGLSSGWSYIIPVISGFKWFPRQRGLVSGLLQGCFGMGGVMFDFIQTIYINPENLQPNDVQIIGKRKESYYTYDSILQRTPIAFLVQTAIAIFLQLVGILLQFEAADHSQQETEMKSLLQHEEKSSSTKEKSEDQTSSAKIEEEEDNVQEKEPTAQTLDMPHTEERDHQNIPSSSTSDKEFTERRGNWRTPEHQPHQGVVVGSEPLDPKSSGLSLSVYEVVKRPYIWQYIAMNAATVLTGLVCVGSYKAFGLLFFPDDLFLAGLGSTASIFNFLGHLFIGLIIDRASIKITTILLCGMMSSLVLIFPATPYGGRLPFVIVVCAVFFILGGIFAIQPVIAFRAFGEEHFLGNLTLIVILGLGLPNILGNLLTLALKFISWTVMYISFGILPGIAMFAGMFMNLKNLQGNDV